LSTLRVFLALDDEDNVIGTNIRDKLIVLVQNAPGVT
jgi:hypothetical protein